MQAFHYTRRTFDDAVRPYGITATQLGVLNRLAERPGLSGAELGRLMLTTSQAAQLMLAALERKGLIKRTPDPNHGRIVRSGGPELALHLEDKGYVDIEGAAGPA